MQSSYSPCLCSVPICISLYSHMGISVWVCLCMDIYVVQSLPFCGDQMLSLWDSFTAILKIFWQVKRGCNRCGFVCSYVCTWYSRMLCFSWLYFLKGKGNFFWRPRWLSSDVGVVLQLSASVLLMRAHVPGSLIQLSVSSLPSTLDQLMGRMCLLLEFWWQLFY